MRQLEPLLLLVCAMVAVVVAIAGCQARPVRGAPPPSASVGGEEAVPHGRTWVVAQSQVADDAGPGDLDHPLRTIQAAAERAVAGDTVLVQAGTYREHVAPVRGGSPGHPITFRAAPGTVVRVVGCDPWNATWKPVEGDRGVWQATLPAFPGFNPFVTGFRCGWDPARQRSPLVRPVAAGAACMLVNGQVIVDGRLAIQVGDRETLLRHPGTWMVDASGQLVLLHAPDGADPARHAIELTVRDRLFAPRQRGLGHIVVQGFSFEFCANQGPWPSQGAVAVRAGHDWVIRDNVVRWCNSIGIDAGAEHWNGALVEDPQFTAEPQLRARDNQVLGNTVTDNGEIGIFAMELRGASVIRGNRVERNNRGGWTNGDPGTVWEEWAGIKLMCTSALVEGNLVVDNDAHGIWMDNHVKGARVTRNVVLNNRRTGIFVEYTHGTILIDNNLVAGTGNDGTASGGTGGGHGIYTHDAADVVAVHNLILDNAGAGILMRTITEREDFLEAPHLDRPLRVVTAGQRIFGNIIGGNRCGAVVLPWDDGVNRDNRSDGNLILSPTGSPCSRLPFGFPTDHRAEAPLADFLRKVAPGTDPAGFPLYDQRQWTAMTGNEGASRQADARVRYHLRAGLPELQGEGLEHMPAGLTLPESPDLQDIALERDLLGQPYPARDRRVPGPIQDSRPGRREWPLWPLVQGE